MVELLWNWFWRNLFPRPGQHGPKDGGFLGEERGGFDLGYLVWCLGARVWVGGMVGMLWFYGIRAEEDLVEEGLVGWGSGDSGASFVYL